VRDILLQQWWTARCTAGTGAVNNLTQDEEYWVDSRGITECAALLDVSDLVVPASATVTLSIETAPTPDENLFTPIGPPLVFDGIDVGASPIPYQLKTVRTPSTSPPCGLLRWKLAVSAGASGPWGMTFRIRLVPGRSRFFVPTDIAGNVAWHRSDIGITKETGNRVTIWADQSGQSHDLTAPAGSAQRPTWTTNVINGRPALSFDPALGAQFMSTAAFALGTYTLLLVTTGQDASNGFFFTRSTAGVTVDTLYGSTGDTTDVGRGGTLSAYDHVANWGQWGPTTAKLIVQRFDGTHAGHTVTLNTSAIATTSLAAGDPGTATTTDKLVLAARNDGFLGSKMKVAEAILYNRALAADELAVVQEYLRRRYGLY